VDAVHANTEGLSEFNVCVNSIRSILALNCTFEVKFTRRHANMIAHSIARARAAISYASHQVYGYVPPCIHLY